MAGFVESDYQRWDASVVEWPGIEAFLEATLLADGVHVIAAHPGPPLEILLRRTDSVANTSVLPVFLTGAVEKRSEKTGPFFSGDGIGSEGDFGFAAISDPSLNLDASLGLGWYAGNRYQDVQGMILRVLRKIADYYRRELLFVGGSGGGFAALYFGLNLNAPCSVLAWNPQTDIFKYSPSAVKNYMKHAYGPGIVASLEAPSWEAAAAAYLEDQPIATNVLDMAGSSNFPRRLLVFQNATDWHVTHHFAPFMKVGAFQHIGRGVHQRANEQLGIIASFGIDHAPLPSAAILAGVLTALDADAPSTEILRHVRAALPLSSTPVSSLPRNLGSLASTISRELALTASPRADAIRVEVEHGSVPRGYGGLQYSFFCKVDGGEAQMQAVQREPLHDFTQAGLTEVGVVVRDGFLNEIVVLRESVE